MNCAGVAAEKNTKKRSSRGAIYGLIFGKGRAKRSLFKNTKKLPGCNNAVRATELFVATPTRVMGGVLLTRVKNYFLFSASAVALGISMVRSLGTNTT